MIQPNLGDVLVVRTTGLASTLIRFGSALRDEPNLDNHVAIAHHVTNGVTWCVEGKPGGVGWRDAKDYLDSKWTVTNVMQPKTNDQRSLICQSVEAALHTPYDWPAIAEDALKALHLPTLWQDKEWGNQVPGHVVCSSLAAWAYHREGLDTPAMDDQNHTTPGDWEQFIQLAAWAPEIPRHQ